MFNKLHILSPPQIEQLRDISAKAAYVDGKISNPHSKIKNNLQLHDQEAYAESSKILMEALMGHEGFRNCAFPARVAPPMMTRYTADMHYGLHADSALIHLPQGSLRSDLSCTIFLSDPDDYDGGALRVTLGEGELRFKGAPGTAIIYPSNTLHEVEPVTRGERHVAITFIQSQIADMRKRELLYELNEIAALEGNNMSPQNFTRLQAVQSDIARLWTT